MVSVLVPEGVETDCSVEALQPPLRTQSAADSTATRNTAGITEGNPDAVTIDDMSLRELG